MSGASIGAAVMDRRVASGMSQTELAREMRERGFGFHQQTVQRIESGQRPLRWEEGIVLRHLIGFALDESGDDPTILRDALAYRRIRSMITETENS